MSESYVVRPGDSLWAISKDKLGGGKEWPRLWRYNNRPAIIKVTGKGIPNPDLIFPGQTLLIPSLPNVRAHDGGGAPPPPPTPRTSGTHNANGNPTVSGPSGSGPGAGQPVRPPTLPPPGGGAPLSHSLPDIQSPISIKYRLDDLRFPPFVQPGVIMEIRMTGDVLLMTRKSYPAVYVTQRREIEAQVVTQANQAFGALVNDTRLIYDARANQLTYRSMLVTQSTVRGAPTTAIGIQIDSTNPIPKLRFEYRFPKLEGSLPLFNYVAMDVKVVVELTPTPLPPTGPSPQPVRAPQPSTNWNKVIGTGLIITAGVIVVGTLVEDFFTAGAGVADDPVSFTAAGASVARGLQMLRGAAVVLQEAAVPAALTLTFTVGAAANMPQGQVQP